MKLNKILGGGNQKKILIAGLGCFFLLLGISFVFSYPYKKNLKQLEQIAREYEAWKADPKPGEPIDQLGKKIISSPLLRYYYLGDLSKELLVLGNIETAEKYSHELFSRASLEIPFFAQYSSISFLMGKKQFQQALVASYRLKKEMLIDPLFLQGQATSLLFTMNLLRISVLEKILYKSSMEFEALTVLENYLGKNSDEPLQEIVSKQVERLFQSNGKVYLKDYVSFRKCEIEKSLKTNPI